MQNEKQLIDGYKIDRTFEFYEPDGYVTVTSPEGDIIDFWLFGLSDDELIHRFKEIKKYESAGH